MKVKVSKQNKAIITQVLSSVKFIDQSETTCMFNVKRGTIDKLYSGIKELGYNPYSIIVW